MARLIKRICGTRTAQGDTNVAARFTVRALLNQRPDSARRREAEYTIDIKSCGKQAK